MSPWYKAGVTITSGCGRIMLVLVCIGSLHGNTMIDGVPQVTQFNVNAGRMLLAASAMLGIGVAYYLALRSRALARGPWLAFPDELWKLSVYRGAVRVMLALLWLGLYGVFMYEEVEGVAAFRTCLMTTLGCVALLMVVIESWVMIGNRDINHLFDFLMPPPPPPEVRPGTYCSPR